MSPAVRPVVRTAALLLAVSAVLVGYQSLSAPNARRSGLVARAWAIGIGDPESSVKTKLGEPVREVRLPDGQRLLRFEEGGRAVEVSVGGSGVTGTTVYEVKSDARTAYPIVPGEPNSVCL